MNKLFIFLPTLGFGGAEISLSRVSQHLSDNFDFDVKLVIAKKLNDKLELQISDTLDIEYLDSSKTFFSIINPIEKDHIGEAQLFIDDALGDAQLSVLIGRKDLWHLGYGSSSVITLMDHAFNELDLYRVWVDIPEYNTHARNMFESLGFQHEGTLRQSRPHHGARYNSAIMGMLKNEFIQIYGEDLEKLFK